jgi:cytochrome P450
MLAKLLSLAKCGAANHTVRMEEPSHVLAAPAHRDPYPWYARQRVSRPIFFDAALGLWVVSGPYLVDQALRQPLLRVRPPAEPVPRALQGRSAGEVFSLLVRMNDGEFHDRHRPDVDAGATRFDTDAVAGAAEAATRDLHGRCDANALLSAIPVQAMARLLGVPAAGRDRTVAWVHDFTQGIVAGASPDAIARADVAAHALMEQGEREGLARVRAANRIAFMQQALDATAGLLGNAIVAALADATGDDAHTLVARVARSDPAIHNTRRFAAADVELGGEHIATGQGLVLVLVPSSPFGAGPHACPGERIARQVAATALHALRQSAPLARTFGRVQGYRPLPNARIPVFTT